MSTRVLSRLAGNGILITLMELMHYFEKSYKNVIKFCVF